MQTGGTHPNPGGVPPVSRKSSMSSQIVTSTPRNERLLHPLPLRIMHWINAVAIFIMIGSGWKIYNDDAIFGFLHFPDAVVIGNGHSTGCNGISSACGFSCSMASPTSLTASSAGGFGRSFFRFRRARFSSQSAKPCGFACVMTT